MLIYLKFFLMHDKPDDSCGCCVWLVIELRLLYNAGVVRRRFFFYTRVSNRIHQDSHQLALCEQYNSSVCVCYSSNNKSVGESKNWSDIRANTTQYRAYNTKTGLVHSSLDAFL